MCCVQFKNYHYCKVQILNRCFDRSWAVSWLTCLLKLLYALSTLTFIWKETWLYATLSDLESHKVGKKAQNCMIFMIFAIFDQFWFFVSRAKFWNLISNPIISTFPSNIHHILASQAQKMSQSLTLRFTVFDNFFRFLLKMTFKQV